MCLAMPPKTIEVDYDHPRNGPVCFAAEAGDRIKLAWREQHNLHRFPSRHDYDSCAFGAAERLASAGPRPEGVVVDFGGDDAYFACSKICKSNGHKVRICLNNPSGCRGCGFVNGSAIESRPSSRGRHGRASCHPERYDVRALDRHPPVHHRSGQRR